MNTEGMQNVPFLRRVCAAIAYNSIVTGYEFILFENGRGRRRRSENNRRYFSWELIVLGFTQFVRCWKNGELFQAKIFFCYCWASFLLLWLILSLGIWTRKVSHCKIENIAKQLTDADESIWYGHNISGSLPEEYIIDRKTSLSLNPSK